MIPYALSQQWVDSHRWFIQNQKLRIVHQCHSKWNSALLASAATS
jgi:hypothetical protein